MQQIAPPLGYNIDEACDKLAASGTEHAHQQALFAWLNYAYHTDALPHPLIAFAVPNGGQRSAVQGALLKAEGVKPGVPDIVWPLRTAWFPGLYVEMKVRPKGVVKPEQASWHSQLRGQGYAVAVCWNWRAARRCFLEYAKGGTVDLEYE